MELGRTNPIRILTSENGEFGEPFLIPKTYVIVTGCRVKNYKHDLLCGLGELLRPCGLVLIVSFHQMSNWSGIGFNSPKKAILRGKLDF